MIDKLTTAEVRLAATTNEDLPLRLYKKLEAGFDAWLESVKAEAVAAANGSGKPSQKAMPAAPIAEDAKKAPTAVKFEAPVASTPQTAPKAKKTKSVDWPVIVETRELTPEEIEQRNKQRSKRGRKPLESADLIISGPGRGQLANQVYKITSSQKAV